MLCLAVPKSVYKVVVCRRYLGEKQSNKLPHVETHVTVLIDVHYMMLADIRCILPNEEATFAFKPIKTNPENGRTGFIRSVSMKIPFISMI